MNLIIRWISSGFHEAIPALAGASAGACIISMNFTNALLAVAAAHRPAQGSRTTRRGIDRTDGIESPRRCDVSHRTRQVLLMAALLALAVYTAPPVTTASSLVWCVAGWFVILFALAATARLGSAWSMGTRLMALAPALVVADLLWSRPTPRDAAVVVTITVVAVWIAIQQRRRPVIQYLYLSRF